MEPDAPQRRSAFPFINISAETKLTLLLVAVSFFISGVPRVYTQTAAHTLFLEEFGSEAMPFAYIADALFIPMAGWLYMLAARRLPLRTLLVGTLAIDAAVQVAFRTAIWLDVPYAAAGTIVWFEIEFVLSSLCVWGLANSMMTLRQGKRLFGYVSAGEPVAIIICGATTPLVLNWLQPADLFLFSALGAGVGIAIILYITANFQPPSDGAGSEESEGAEDGADGEDGAAALPWWRKRYVMILVSVCLISQLGYFFIDNAFYMEASARYPEEEDLAKFLGVYSAVMGVVSLSCSLFLAAPLVRRFGIRGALLTLPLLLSAGTLAVIVAGWAGAGASLIFWLVVSNKVIDQAIRYTIDKANSVTLYQPLPARERMEVQAASESMIEPLSGGIAGAALYLLINYLGFTAFHLTHLIAVIALTWAAMVFIQHRGYLNAINQALARRQVMGVDLALNDEATMQALKQSLASHRAGEVVYGLKLLNDAGWKPEIADTQPLLTHAAKEVRLEVARQIEQGRLPLSGDIIHDRIAHENDARVRGALIEALAAKEPAGLVDILRPMLDDPSLDARLGAYVGLIRHGGPLGERIAGERLFAAETDPNPQARRFVALVIGRLAAPQFGGPLNSLLVDADPVVRSAALHAAGSVGTPDFWPSILESLAIPRVDRHAITAAQMIGEPILDVALDLFGAEDTTYPTRRGIIILAGRIASPKAIAWLLDLLEHPDRRLKNNALNALWLNRHKAGPAEYPMLRRVLKIEAAEAGRLLGAWKTLDPAKPAVQLLRSSLEAEVNGAIHNLFCLMALLLDDVNIREARINYTRGGPVRRAYVIEMFDNALDSELQTLLLPLLEAESTEERALRAPMGTEASMDIVQKLAREREGALRGWTQACALRAMAGEKISEEELRPALRAEEKVVREIAQRLLAGPSEVGESRTMLIIEKVLILRSVSIFAEVSEQYLNHLAASAQEVRLAAGETLFSQGDFGTALYVILHGKVRVHVGETTIAELGDLQVVGEMAALDPEPRSASVSAVEKSLLLRITSDDLDLLLSDDVEVARGIIRVLCQRLRLSAAARPKVEAPAAS